jgi:hypothetical protein
MVPVLLSQNFPLDLTQNHGSTLLRADGSFHVRRRPQFATVSLDSESGKSPVPVENIMINNSIRIQSIKTHAEAESILGLLSSRSLSCNSSSSSLDPRFGNLLLRSTRLNRFSQTFCDWCATSRLSVSRFKTFFASSSDDRSSDCRRRSLSEDVT